MPLPLYQVDAFTEAPFSGNPAAVVVLEDEAPEAWMQHVAGEMNLSETAFLLQDATGWRLRWFTPLSEVDLCGHATLASAHALWETGRLAKDERARFSTRSGPLGATLLDDGLVELDLPAYPPHEVPAPKGLAEAIGAEPVATYESRGIAIAELSDEGAVRGLAPRFDRFHEGIGNSILVTAPGETADYVLRYFAPAYGIPEDPVTGSAQCPLGPLWGERLGKDVLEARQLSSRGGALRVSLRDGRVGVAGRAVTVLEGSLLTEP